MSCGCNGIRVRGDCAEPDVDHDNRAGRIAIDEQTAFDGAEGHSEIGVYMCAGCFARGCVDAARNIE